MKRSLWILLAISIYLGGCGDNIEVLDFPGPDDPIESHATVIAVSGDFSSGVGLLSTIGIPTLEVDANAVEGVASQDPVLRLIDDRLYIINRFGQDNVTILGAADRSLVQQISTGEGSNPQDVAVKGTTLYVAALNRAGVLVIDPSDPTAIETIDLSALDANDGIPDCNSVALVDDLLFVTCGILQNFVPAGPGKVAVIDTTDNSLVDTLDLETANPFGFLYATPAAGGLGGDLLMATVDFGSGLTAGCVERIGVSDPPEAKGCLLQNTDLGGYASGYTSGDGELFVTVTSGFDKMGTAAHVEYYAVADDQLMPSTFEHGDQRLFDVARCPTGEWVFADAAGGIRVYDVDEVELTTEPVDIGLPPIANGMVCL